MSAPPSPPAPLPPFALRYVVELSLTRPHGFLLRRYQRTTELLTEKEEELKTLAEELLKVETINHDEIVRLIGPRPYDGGMAEIREQLSLGAQLNSTPTKEPGAGAPLQSSGSPSSKTE